MLLVVIPTALLAVCTTFPVKEFSKYVIPRRQIMNKRSLEASVENVITILKLNKLDGDIVRVLARSAYATGRVDSTSETLEKMKEEKRDLNK